MFKNAIIYRINLEAVPGMATVTDGLARHEFAECLPTQETSFGWVPPREENGALLESVGGQWIAKLVIETRTVPADTIKREVKKKVALITEQTGRKPGRSEQKDIKADVLLELLPKAFPKRVAVLVWINVIEGYAVLDTASQARADLVATEIVQAMPEGFSMALLNTAVSPARAMTTWLMERHVGNDFSIGDECVLKATDDSETTVKYIKHPLFIGEIREHIQHGKEVTDLALTHKDRLAFVLTDGLVLKRIELLDAVFQSSNGDAGGFDADVAILTGELSPAIRGLAVALS